MFTKQVVLYKRALPCIFAPVLLRFTFQSLGFMLEIVMQISDHFAPEPYQYSAATKLVTQN